MYSLRSSQKGFVILLAVLISASILMIGAGIFSSAFKETILASASTESQVALFVADTGMECALYAEFVNGVPAEECAGEGVSVDNEGDFSEINTALFSYEFRYSIPNTPSCGKVTVDRNVGPGGGTNTGNGTNIIARGYNFCSDTEPDISNPTLVERRLEVWYPNAAPVVDEDAAAAEDGG